MKQFEFRAWPALVLCLSLISCPAGCGHAEPPQSVVIPAPSAAAYKAIDSQVQANLKDQIIAMWFPRAVDSKNGGFHETFSYDWSSETDDQKSIVYQSRLTWVASEIALRYPDKTSEYDQYGAHGFDFLATKQADSQDGGLFWAVDESGAPDTRYGTGKHSYGTSFAIYAAVAEYKATHDPKALEFAKSNFEWLDKHAHDAQHGGYYEALARDGTPILSAPSPTDTQDEIGTAYGEKSMNTHIHLLESLTALYQVWPDPTLHARLLEMFLLVRDRIASPDGYLVMFFQPDWRPVEGNDSYGHDIETAYLLTEAASALGIPDDPTTWKVARHLVDHVLKYGWDTIYGGIYDYGNPNGVSVSTTKIWWEQAEALNALLLMHQRYGKQDPEYWNAFVREWDFIQKRQVDRVNKGWYGGVDRDGSPPYEQNKSDGWTEAYHQGRAMLNVSARLEELASGQ